MREVTIAVVTALAPSPTTLSEYGLHLLTALGRKRGVRVVALVEALPVEYPAIPGVEIIPTWEFDSVANAWRIPAAVRSTGADVALFNAHFTSFGSSRVAAALGLLTPFLTRLAGPPVITLLHNIVEAVDLRGAGFSAPRGVEALLRLAGTAVTWFVLRSDVVLTTMPRYVDVLRAKYRVKHVALAPHGAFDVPAPPAAPPEQPVISTFGKFGTYKRVDVVIDAVRRLGRDDARCVIAGTDSPNAIGYLAEVEARSGGADVRFSGYVAESEVEALFRGSTVTVFPYSSTTGSSGVLHQAAAFGCAPVMPRIGDLEQLVEHEGFTGAFFELDDVDDLARAIRSVLEDEDARRRIVEHNYAAACGLTLDDVADWYLVHASMAIGSEPTRLLRAAAVDPDGLRRLQRAAR
ncbi:glycosyltransferase [Amnibacterium kyonggiense]